jgi:8-oxo-dGTP diphosphatase
MKQRHLRLSFRLPPEGLSQIILGVSGVAMRSGEILLARRGRGPYAGCWSLPGGKVEHLEPHQQSLVREFREETGLQVAVKRPAGITEAIDPDGVWHYVILSYFVEVTGGTPTAGDDASEVRWFARNDLSGLELTPGLEGYLEEFGCWSK